MFDTYKEFFGGEGSLDVTQDNEVTPQDLQIAVVALLVTIARSDANFDESELSEIVKLAGKQFDLIDSQSAALVEIARFMMDEDSGKLYEFIEMVRDSFNESQRIKLLSLVWTVIEADGKVDPEEALTAAAIRKDLNLSLEQAMRAQQLAKQNDS